MLGCAAVTHCGAVSAFSVAGDVFQEPSMDQVKQDGNGNERGAKAPLLTLKKSDKRFGATDALKAVDLEFEAGEVHAIVGENGAGKSTLIKMLTWGTCQLEWRGPLEGQAGRYSAREGWHLAGDRAGARKPSRSGALFQPGRRA